MQTSLAAFEPIADHVFVAVAEPASVNIGLVVGRDAALVIDTGSSPAQGAAIRRAAEAAAGVPVRAVLVTHWHWDHFFGLAGFDGVPSYGHRTLTDWLRSDGLAASAAEAGVPVTALTAPTHPFTLARVIDLGDRRVELVHFGRGHSDGDTVAVVPDADVIFAGDLLEESGPPAFGPDCYPKEWPSAVDGILGLVNEHTILVPGHGRTIDRMYAFDQRARISGLYGQAEHLARRGVKLADAYAAGEWPFPEEVVHEALPIIYEQLAADGIHPGRTIPLL
ncbi:MAG: MBL fold metallo-hydrolase [Actinobacteria bacterium]|nr:MBL fold metallo-hydrolase [Actinomycetota bacterium]